MPKRSCGLVSGPRLIKPIVPISSNGLTCGLRSKGYETDPVGWAFDRGSRRRSWDWLKNPSFSQSHCLLHRSIRILSAAGHASSVVESS